MERETGPSAERPDREETAFQGFGEWSYLSPATESDADLMKRAKIGNRTAYGILFGRLSGRLWSLAYLMLHEAAAADEVLRRTFLLGQDQIAAYRDGGEPAAWFCGIALGLCRRATREGGTAPPAPPDSPRKTVVMALRRETARQLAVAIGFLDDDLRETFLLRYVEGLSYEEIAGILDIDPATARLRGHQARLALREHLGRDFVPSDVAS